MQDSKELLVSKCFMSMAKHLRQTTIQREILNSAYRSSIVETAFWQVAGEEWDENEIDWVEKFRKRKMAAVFSCSHDRVGRAGKVLVFFLLRKRNLVDFLG